MSYEAPIGGDGPGQGRGDDGTDRGRSRGRVLVPTLIALGVLVVGWVLFASFYSEWLWYSSVGMTQVQLMRRIILPQAARVAAPTLLNYFIDMIKSTSLASRPWPGFRPGRPTSEYGVSPRRRVIVSRTPPRRTIRTRVCAPCSGCGL